MVSADDAVLAEPASPLHLDVGGVPPCRVLTGTAGIGGCGVAGGAGGRLAWHLSDSHSPDPTSINVYRIEGDSLTQTLELPEATRPDAESGVVKVADLDGRAGDELVVGFRNTGTGAYLQLDVVGGDGTVQAHLTLDQGRAVVRPGGIEVWEARYGPDDPNCCPSSFDHSRIVFDGDHYRRVEDAPVPTAQVPQGQYP